MKLETVLTINGKDLEKKRAKGVKKALDDFGEEDQKKDDMMVFESTTYADIDVSDATIYIFGETDVGFVSFTITADAYEFLAKEIRKHVNTLDSALRGEPR